MRRRLPFRLVHYPPDLPEVVGVVNYDIETAQDYAKSHSLNFSTLVIKSFLFSKLVIAQYGSVKASSLCQSYFFNKPQRRRRHREKKKKEKIA